MRRNKYIIAIAAGIFSLSMLSGCQTGKQPEMKVSIQDGQVETRLSVAKGSTVSAILKEAEITLNKKDEITPSLTTKLESGDKEIQISRYEKLKVSDDDKVQEVEILGGKVKDVLKKAGITLGKHDIVNHDPEASCTDDMDIQVIRRVEVSLKADGNTKKSVTQAKTVKELLDENNIILSKKDRVKPAQSKVLKEGMKVIVERVETRKEKKTEEIPFSVETQKSSSMYVGSSKVTREGVNGSKEVTYQITYVDGKEESRKKVKEKVTKEPVSKIVTEGTKEKPQPSSGSSGGSSKKSSGSGKHIVSKRKVPDCDGSGHGYWEIRYSDGSTTTKNY